MKNENPKKIKILLTYLLIFTNYKKEKMNALKTNPSQREQKVMEDQAKRKDIISNADKKDALLIMNTEKS